MPAAHCAAGSESERVVLHPVLVKWGPKFANTPLDLNDLTNYAGATSGTRDGAEQNVLLAENTQAAPSFIRAVPRERVFSHRFLVLGNADSNEYHARVDLMYRALYSGLIRIYVHRGYRIAHGVTYKVFRYIECVCSAVKQISAQVFEAQFTAANPFFVLDNATAESGIDTAETMTGEVIGDLTTVQARLTLIGGALDAPEEGHYQDMVLPYAGTAPVEPLIIFQIGGRGGVYEKYKAISITNNFSEALLDQPICIAMGDIRAAVGTDFHEIGANDLGVDTHMLKDIRIETLAGTRKIQWLRDSGAHGGTWHQDVRLWTVIHHLEPGATVIVRVLFDNINALPEEVYPEQSAIKAMFNMFASDNDAWFISDFAPSWSLPQTRLHQWSAYAPARWNIAWIAHRHDAFDNLTGEANVNCAGARATLYGPASGATGLQWVPPYGISSIAGIYRISTNAKTPFLLRWQRRNLEWQDAGPGDAFWWNATSTMRASVVSYATSGTTVIYLDRTIAVAGVEYFSTLQQALVRYADGSAGRHTITAVNNVAHTITLSPAIPSGKALNVGSFVQAVISDSFSRSFTAPDYPRLIAFILRGDHPDLVTGDWYFGGVESLTVTFSSEKPNVTAWADAPVVDVAHQRYQLTGRFGNPMVGTIDPITGNPLGEFLRINYITNNIKDRVVVDCRNRKVWYYEWDESIQYYKAKQDIFGTLTREEVRYFWIHLEPSVTNVLRFVHDPASNFKDTDVYAQYQTLYWG